MLSWRELSVFDPKAEILLIFYFGARNTEVQIPLNEVATNLAGINHVKQFFFIY